MNCKIQFFNQIKWIFLFLLVSSSLFSAEPFIEFKGTVVDKSTNIPLAFAGISVSGSNVSTVSNTEGEFVLKVFTSSDQAKINVQYIGFVSETLTLAELKQRRNKIELTPMSIELPEISVISVDAEELMRTVFEKIHDNYPKNSIQMTAFYRETIKNNSTYVSLSEAVLDILKEPITSYRNDIARFYKARKKVDYNKLDTLVFKLQGGPYNSLNLDIVKNPEYVFSEDIFKNYKFTFDRSTRIDNRLIYVIEFSQNPQLKGPNYLGKIYVDAQTLAIKSAVFNLNLQNKEEAASLLIVKKPLNAKITPVVANYRIDYVEKEGKWYYNYSRIELDLKINWKRKLFNTTYHSTIEMAVTDWTLPDNVKAFRYGEHLKPSVVVSDEPIGFTDPEFWGDFNVIEPEKSIESAIKKIKKQIEKSY
jgi:hypothetical protein